MADLPKGAERYARRLSDRVVQHLMRLPGADFDEAWHTYRGLLQAEENVKTPAERTQMRLTRALAGLVDRYYLLVFLLGRRDFLSHGWAEHGKFGDPDYCPAGNRWLYERCREVERDPDDRLDLWSREHYKSTIITYGGGIQDELIDPELTTCIFSVTRPLAKKHLRAIKVTLETNHRLIRTYPDVLWAHPRKEAPKWSEDEGLVLKRSGTPKEATFEAWGLIDAMPTGAHFGKRMYDDVIRETHAKSPEMVAKATEQFELSDNLGKKGGRKQVVGTRYSFADSYQTMLDRKVLVARLYPATADGTAKGRPVFLSQAQWNKKKLDQPTTFAAQLLQNPAAGQDTTFKPEWLRSYEVRPETLHVYIMGDPSKGRTARSDRTAMAVIGLDSRENKYLLDGYCHRMNLGERREALVQLHDKWRNRIGVQACLVGYEQYGLQTDLEHFEQMGRIDGKELAVEELNWVREGGQSKRDRVERLVPDFAQGRFFVPLFAFDAAEAAAAEKGDPSPGLVRWRVAEGRVHWDRVPVVNGRAGDDTRARAEARARRRPDLVIGPIKRLDEEGRAYDLTARFIEEFLYFPFGQRKDFIDAMSRIYDMEPTAPLIVPAADLEPSVHVDT
jgi:hypothetical protein